MIHPKKERTLILVKPDGVQRSLIGEIISRFERLGLKLAAMKFFIATEKQAASQYGSSQEEIRALGQRSIENQAKHGAEIKISAYEHGEWIVNKLKKYVTSGPMVAMIWEGNQVVEITKKIIGSTEPLMSDVGTIRGDFTIDSYDIADGNGRAVRNLIHRSGSIEEAEKEIKIWFKPDEILDYRLVNEKILYDVNLDGILE